MSICRLITLSLACLCASLLGPPAVAANEASSYYEDGLKRFHQDDVKGAVVQLKNALQEDPEMLSARLLLGRAWVELEHGAAAEQEFLRALAAGVDRSLVVEPLAEAYLLQGKYKTLVASIDSRGLSPEAAAKVEAHRGHALTELRKYEQASKAFHTAMKLHPSSPEAAVGQSRLALRRGRPEKAAQWASRAVETAPDSAVAWAAVAATAHARQQVDKALDAYAKALELDAGDVDTRVARLALLIDQVRFEEAERELKLARAGLKSEPRLLYLESLLHAHHGRREQARAAMQAAADRLGELPAGLTQSRAQLLMLSGLVHYSLEQHERARADLTRYIERFPSHAGARKLLASVFLALGDVSAGIAQLEAAQRTAPADPQLLTLLGSAYMRAGSYHHAARAFERAAHLRRQDSRSQFDAALSRLAAGEHAQAMVQLQTLSEDKSGEYAPAIVLALTHLQRGELAAAEPLVKRLADRHPDNPVVQNLYGLVLLAKGEAERSREVFSSVLKHAPDFDAARLGLARAQIALGEFETGTRLLMEMSEGDQIHVPVAVTLARLYIHQGHYKQAIKLLEKALAEVPASKRIQLTLVEAWLEEGNHRAALEVAERAVARLPEDYEILYAFARTQIAAGQRGAAAVTLKRMTDRFGFQGPRALATATLQQAIGARSDAVYSLEKGLAGEPGYLPVRVALADNYLRMARIEDAERLAREMPEQEWQRHRLLGDVALARERPASALNHYRDAVSLQRAPVLAIRIYEAKLRSGDSEGAVQSLEDWLERSPSHEVVRRRLAQAYLELGRSEAATGAYRQLLAEVPDDVTALNNLAALRQAEAPEDALALARRAYALAPNDPAINDTLGWILVQQGDPAAGLRYLRSAHVREAGHPEILYHLGVALMKLGRTEEARMELEKALSTGVEFNGRQRAQVLLDELSSRP